MSENKYVGVSSFKLINCWLKYTEFKNGPHSEDIWRLEDDEQGGSL